MTSLSDTGKYRKKSELNSSPPKSKLDDYSNLNNKEKTNKFILNETINSSLPPKPPRRSSLAIGLLGGRTTEKNSKRRSSIAVSLLGKKDNNKQLQKESSSSYETFVKSEKSDGLSRSPELIFHLEHKNLDLKSEKRKNSKINKSSQSDNIVKDDFNDDDEINKLSSSLDSFQNLEINSSTKLENDFNSLEYSDYHITKQTKILDRRRRKNFDFQQQHNNQNNFNGSNNNIKDIIINRRKSTSLTTSTLNKDFVENNDDDEISSNNSLNTTASSEIGYNSNNNNNNQKRHSWWNIFIPEHLKQRSRRASQDVSIIPRHSISISTPVRRSKSRSVDHGLSTSVDLESLRSKVEGRFEDIDRLSKDGEKKKSMPTIPTTTYTVSGRDTLTSVAARFDTTPSELTQLNRLTSSFIYPGQQLIVPDKSIKDNTTDSKDGTDNDTPSNTGELNETDTNDSQLSKDKSSEDEKDILEGLRPGSPKPGHIKRISHVKDGIASDPADDPIITQRFLKIINVRHITDGQGVVGGVLLVTPNAVMFDPDVSDPLAIEHGPEHYGVIVPMELVVNAAIFHDIAHMRVAGGESSNVKVEIYYPKGCHPLGKDSSTSKKEESSESDSKETTQLQSQLDRLQIECDDKEKENNKTDDLKVHSGDNRTLEERRKSLLDHHWAIPSKDRSSIEEDEHSITAESKVNSEQICVQSANLETGMSKLPRPQSNDDESQLSNQSCYDSGIDVCDQNSLPIVQPIPTKKVYSDADIVLSSDWVPPRTISPTQLSDSPPKHQGHSHSASTLSQAQSLDTAGGAITRKKTSSVSFSVEDNEQSQNSQGSEKSSDQNKKNKMLKRLSYPLSWVEGLTGEGGKPNETESAPNTGDSNQSVFSKVFSRRSSIASFIKPTSEGGSTQSIPIKSSKAAPPPQPKLDYRSMVSIDDKPDLFVSFDKLIPRPARACSDPPLYLRLRIGKPIGKAIPLPTSVMSYGKNKLRPEYWFSVPKNRIDELYKFINVWTPHLYGELNEEAIKERGFELIQHDTEWALGNSSKEGRQSSESEDITELTRESWEVLNINPDEYKKGSLFMTGSFDLDFPIPDLIGETEILTEEHREKLCAHLPARAEGYSWTLAFSTSQNGFSLNSLYRKMQKLESPILIIIEDTDHNVFGALTSCSLHVSDHFYGTGESFLFKFNPTFKVFHWTGENMYFIKGNTESLSIGAGDGKFGLWLDGDLNQGRTQSCDTYGNEPLAPQEDFVVKTFECWAFV